MVKDERESKVYTTRVPSDLAERLDVYIENSDATKSKTVKRLLEIGLQIEELEGTPQEQKQVINDLEEEIEDVKAELESERRTRVWYQTVGAVMAAPVLGLLLLAGFLNLLQDRLGISLELTNQIAGIAILAIVLGALFYLVVLLSPYLKRARQRIGSES
jgi:hypothetical protein